MTLHSTLCTAHDKVAIISIPKICEPLVKEEKTKPTLAGLHSLRVRVTKLTRLTISTKTWIMNIYKPS